MVVLTEKPPASFFGEALRACKEELAKLDPPRKFLRLIGETTPEEAELLQRFCLKFNYVLLETRDDIADALLFFDQRVEAVERVLMRYGLELSIQFNIRFFEDCSHLYPADPDNLDDELSKEWNWETLQQEIIEFFYGGYQKELYEAIGFYHCIDELMVWVKLVVSVEGGEEWWEEKINSLDYTTDS